MLLMLRVDVERVLRIEKGEDDREEVVERWSGGGWREGCVGPNGRDMFVLERVIF